MCKETKESGPRKMPILISKFGSLRGRTDSEDHPLSIQEALNAGFDACICVSYEKGEGFYFGSKEFPPSYKVGLRQMKKFLYNPRCWWMCGDLETFIVFIELAQKNKGLKFFHTYPAILPSCDMLWVSSWEYFDNFVEPFDGNNAPSISFSKFVAHEEFEEDNEDWAKAALMGALPGAICSSRIADIEREIRKGWAAA